jgi:hypothetical protein
MSSIAAAAEGKTLLISLRRSEDEKERAKLKYVFVVDREKCDAVRTARDIDGIMSLLFNEVYYPGYTNIKAVRQ